MLEAMLEIIVLLVFFGKEVGICDAIVGIRVLFTASYCSRLEALIRYDSMYNSKCKGERFNLGTHRKSYQCKLLVLGVLFFNCISKKSFYNF